MINKFAMNKMKTQPTGENAVMKRRSAGNCLSIVACGSLKVDVIHNKNIFIYQNFI